MPAVNPTRLRFQIARVMEHFDDPPRFHRELQDVFSRYANRALRVGEQTQRKTLMPTYQLPHPVLRQLHLEIKPRVQEDPTRALNLADVLWKDKTFEVKQTAIFILRMLPLQSPDQLLERIYTWLTPDLDQTLSSELLSMGTLQLHEAFPGAWERLTIYLLENDNPGLVNLGMRGLGVGLDHPSFTNLPAIFRLIGPFIQDPEESHTHALIQVIQALAKRSPTETGFFLQQSLSISESPRTQSLVKRCLPFFPDGIRENLQKTLRKKK